MKIDDHAILVVEDNDDDFFILKRSLEKARLTNPVQRATDGQQAVYYLSGIGPYVDRVAYPAPCLLLLDLKLPVKHGFEVLRWIRAQPRIGTIPVLMLTSSREPSDIRQAYELGANAFLTKPTSIELQVEIALSIANFWLKYNTFDPALFSA